ncbi:MAG: flagellar motor protein MotB [Candidatus Omnitrophica bacterium]|nr:Motility protein B [bacterium]NUN95989.1 flagellar motor protein MotB [Candidatus Omnitrophota bacterium]
MAKKSKCECPPACPEWLITFSDMMSLLLTFFIMLVALANFESQKIKDAIVSLRGAFGYMRPSAEPVTMATPNLRVSGIPHVRKGKGEEKENQRSKIEARILQERLDRVLAAELTKEGIVLVSLSPMFFEPGGATIKPEGYRALALAAEILNSYDNDVRIEGHTSNASPEAEWEYQDLWKLSGARAEAILRFLVERDPKVDAKRLSYAGFGSQKPRVSNKTKIGQAFNDRVEIKILANAEPEDTSAHLRGSRDEIPDDTEVPAPE